MSKRRTRTRTENINGRRGRLLGAMNAIGRMFEGLFFQVVRMVRSEGLGKRKMGCFIRGENIGLLRFVFDCCVFVKIKMVHVN